MRSYVWRDGWVETIRPAGEFVCAESWRHRFGRANGLGLHVRRFAAHAGEVPDGLWEATVALLGAKEELFPRVGATGGSFRLDIRPAPPPRAVTHLTVANAPDPRRFPLAKGPDLARLAEHRARYLAPGTDDVVLGEYAETTTGALVGWDGDTLVVPTGAHLPSVTQRQVADRARALGVEVVSGRLDEGMPLWFMNSVHGVSPVGRIVRGGVAIDVPQHARASDWAAWWWEGFTTTRLTTQL